MLKHETENNCVECDRKCEIFKILSRAELQLLNDHKHAVKYKSGEIIIKQGTAMTHIVSFSNGLAKIYLEGYNNHDLILKIQKPTEIISGPGMFTDKRHHFSMSALIDSTVCLFDINTFKHVIRNNPDFMEGFLSEHSASYISTFQKFLSLTQKQMPGRIADALIYLCEEIFKQNPFNIVLSRQELADMTGMSKESTCRILKDFKLEGIINSRGNVIEILNMKQLKNISLTG